ncbi:MAG: hypothetical protein PVH00_05380 [Gemmatimonadota bacterium]|jgi:hypothetical protein
MTALAEFLFPAPARRSAGAIVGWWERRRLAYNAIVGGAGLLSMGIVNLVSMVPPGPHRLAIPAAAIVVVGIGANVCYSLGPLAEALVEKLSGGKILPVGPALYRMGLTFSVGLVLLPTLLASFDWVVRVVRAIL